MWTLGIEKNGRQYKQKTGKMFFCSIFIVIPPKKIKLGRSFHWGVTTETALHFQTDMWAPRGLENHVLLLSSREPKSGCISLAKWNAGSEWTTLIPLKKKFSFHDFLQLLLLDYKSNWILNGKWQILLSGKSGEMVFIQSKCTQTHKITQAQKN